MYIELTDVREIQSAQNALSQQLRNDYAHRRRRTIGYPAGNFEENVRFAAPSGSDVSWWLGSLRNDQKSFRNFFGRGNPETRETVNIDLQFNFPIETFSRSFGGVFVRDLESGITVLGHRGITTRGRSRVPIDMLFGEVVWTLEQVVSQTPPSPIDVFLVAQVNKPGVRDQIREFSVEMHRAKLAVMQVEDGPGLSSIDLTSLSQHFQSKLKDYFDEFSGKTSAIRRSRVQMNFQHGKVVGALRNQVGDKGAVLKSQAIDLAVISDSQVRLFEVKTGADSQSIYTAIGQLYMHGAVLQREYPSKKVIRYLVIPGTIDMRKRAVLGRELGIAVISYEYDGQHVSFSGL